MNRHNQLTYKIVLVGNEAVGKTTLRKSYMGETFHTSYLPTVGADFSIFNMQTSINGESWIAKLAIWDLAGQEMFEDIRSRFLEGTKIILLVFDVANPKSFLNLKQWLKECFNSVNPTDTFVTIIGNKTDLGYHPTITKQAIDKAVQDLEQQYPQTSMNYIETSALTGNNVKRAFEIAVHSLVKADL